MQTLREKGMLIISGIKYIFHNKALTNHVVPN